MDKNFSGRNWYPSQDKYKKAMDLAKRLLDIDLDIIKKIRAKQPIISKISIDDLILENEKVDKHLASALINKF